jgi:hypothetical protein
MVSNIPIVASDASGLQFSMSMMLTVVVFTVHGFLRLISDLIGGRVGDGHLVNDARQRLASASISAAGRPSRDSAAGVVLVVRLAAAHRGDGQCGP